MSIIPDFNKQEIDAIAADMPPVYCQLSETTLQLCLHLLTRQPESEAFWTLAGADFNDVLRDYVYLAQKELIDAMNPVARDIIFVPYKDVTETNTQDAIEQLEDIKEDAGAAAAVASDLSDHEADTDNPHGVTAEQVGVEAGADVTDATNVTAAGAVMTSGNQSVAGVKTFSSFPITPSSAPTTDYQIANKKYVDDLVPGIGFAAKMSADQNLNGSTNTKINFNTEIFDTDGQYNNSLYRYTPQKAGKYLVMAQLYFPIVLSGYKGQINLYKNGVTTEFVTVHVNGHTNTHAAPVSVAAIVTMNGTTDYLECYGRQNYTSAEPVEADYSWFQAWYLGA